MKTKIARQEAIEAGKPILKTLMQYCEFDYCRYAGSIRRQTEMVGDVEIVCVPRTQQDLWGNRGASLLPQGIEILIADGLLSAPIKNGEKYKQFTITSTGQQLDLFITTPEQWPVIFAIRTGSADFSQKLVTRVNKGGKLPSHLKVLGGYVWEGEKLYHPKPQTEREFLELCGGWVEPQDRII